MASPANCDLDIYRGDTFAHEFNFTTDDDPPETLDVSEYTFKAQIRDRPDQGTVVFAEFTIDDSMASVGVIVLHLTSSQTRINPGYWDLEVDVGGSIQTWLKGAVNVSGDVTREELISE